MLGTLLGVGASLIGSAMQSGTAREASNAQVSSQREAIEEQRRQFDLIRSDLSPYLQGGNQAFAQQLGLLGLGEEGAEQEAISAIKESPTYQNLISTGEERILQNQSALGGVRGGDIVGALAQFGPGTLSNLLSQRYQQLGGLSSLGQQSAVQSGQFGSQMASNIGNSLGNIGQSQANRALAVGQSQANILPNIFQSINQLQGLGAF